MSNMHQSFKSLHDLFLPVLNKFLSVLILFLLQFCERLNGQTIDLSKPVGSTNGSLSLSATGGATYSIPIEVLKGVNGLQPQISLNYNSQAYTGIAGFGWSLQGFSAITRTGKSQYYNGINGPVNYTNSNDAFVLDGQHLFNVTGNNGDNGAVYGIENESFAKIESFGGTATLGPDWFKVTTKDGKIMEFGHDVTTKLLTDNGQSNMVWLLNKVTDKNGNYQIYKYAINQTDRNFALIEINYTGNANNSQLPYNKIEFSYAARPAWERLKRFDGGATINFPFLLTKISVKNAAGTIVKSYECGYAFQNEEPFLKQFIEKGSDGIAYNPLVFYYGSNLTASDVDISLQYPGLSSNNTYAGDLTGDGRQDLVAARFYYDNNNIPHYTAYDVISGFSSYGGQPGFALEYTDTITGTNAVEVMGSSNGYYNFLTYDYDGDTKQDVLMINNTISGTSRIFNGIKINYSRFYNIYQGTTYASVDYNSIPHVTAYVNDFKYVYPNGTYYIPGDFDGDGTQDYILILGLNSTANYKAFFSSPKKNIINQEITNFGVGVNTLGNFFALTVAKEQNVTPIDFDGDGKMELLVQQLNSSTILSITTTAPPGYNYAATQLNYLTNIRSGYRIFPGDFNGDGKTDLLARSSATDASAAWNILYSTGTLYKSYPFIFQNRAYLDGDNGGSAHHLMVADLNHDGRSDVWHSLDLTAATSRHTIYHSVGIPLDNNNSTSAFIATSYDKSVGINREQNTQSVIGEFNGDGKPDILSIVGSNGKFIYPKPYKEDHNLVEVVNGLGVESKVNYRLTYSRTSAYEYDQAGVPPGQGVNGNPYNVLNTPMYLVDNLSQSNGIGGYSTTYMSYEDAAYHPHRGFLGFKKVTANSSSGITNTTNSDINTALLVLYPVKQTTQSGATLVSETYITNNLVRVVPSSYFDKRYVHQVIKNTSLNYSTGAGAESANVYDNYGNITSNVVKTGSFSGTVISPVETTTTTATYGTYNTPVPAYPQNITVSKQRVSQTTKTKSTVHTYQPNGLLATVTDFSGTPIATTTTNTYDVYGNLKTQSVSAPGTLTPALTNTYDNTGKYLIKKEVTASGVTKKETYAYNSLNDNISSSTSSDGLITSFYYDGFGRVIKKDLPDNNSITLTTAWESATGRYSITSQRLADGGLWNKIYFDLVNREIRKEQNSFNNKLLISAKTFNNKGQVASETVPYFTGETISVKSYTYDNLGRVTNVSDGSTGITNTYTALAGGLYKTTTTNSAGQSSSQTADAPGKIVSSLDPGGQINFTYESWGNQIEAKLSTIILITNTFDNYGRQLSLTDKNAGTINYEYNALGKITKQTDANGNIYTLTYDGFGRISSRAGPEGNTTYTYYYDAATGKANDNLTNVTGPSGDIKTYQYDNLQRLITENHTITGTLFSKTFNYDAYSNLIKTTHPSGLIINDTYDKNGILTQTSMTNAGVTTTLFTATNMNGRGVYTGYQYGNGKASTVNYDLVKGVPTRYYTTGIQDLNMNFDANTGNLLSRNDAIKTLTETFTYDNLNRLTGASVNSVQQFNMTYDGTGSYEMGNIKNKSDIGNYRYDAQKINAVRFIVNSTTPTTPPGVISTNIQDITYTPFLKAATIAENTYQLTYTYGSDQQRIKSILKQNTTTLETKYYLGAFERLVKGSVTKDIHYINAGNGLCAIIVKQGTTVTPYFIYSDHLGSILTVTDVAGTIVAQQNFDAWGRNRNPATWTYASVPVSPDWLYRGFTGHEHLAQFALINMNGRMYDPAQGRMLSSDNYVQAPYNTQSYNRYTYCINNPLKYKDINGEWFGLDDLVAGIIGGVINLGGALLSGQHMSLGQAFGYFGVGFASGVAFEYGGPLAAGAISGFGNSLVSGSNFQTALSQGLIGAASFALGGAAGKQISGVLANAGIGGFINGAISGAVGGAVGGFVGGIANGDLNGMDLSSSFNMGLKSALTGAAYGGALGGAFQGIAAYKDNRNFWTGKAIAPGRSAFAFDNNPTTQSHYAKQVIDSYNQNGDKISSHKVWLKDITSKGASVTNYEVWGTSPQEMWDIFTNYNGGSISNVVRAGPVYGLNGQSYFYNSSATSTQGASIYFTINRVQIYKFRFP